MAKQRRASRSSAKRTNWLKWGIIGFVGLGIISALFPSDKTRNAQRTLTAAQEVVAEATKPSIDTHLSLTDKPKPAARAVSHTPIVSFTPSRTITDTPVGMKPATIPATPAAVLTLPPTTYYTTSEARLRSCPRLDCNIITTVAAGTSLVVNGQIEGDTATTSSRIWYLTTINGQEAYVYSALVSQTAPVSVSSGSSGSSNIAVPPPSNNSGASCPSLSATCPNLTCAQAYACLAAGNNSLDRDDDGMPCESVCNGG